MYAVEQRYLNNGAVLVKVREAKDDEKPSMKECKGYDEYIDIFRTKEDAEKFAQDCLEA